MTTTFIDVSGYDNREWKNGGWVYDLPMDWSKQIANKATFAFIKCSEYVEDPGFEVQWSAAAKTNLILGAWHFFHPSVNAITQAQMQISILKKVGLSWSGDPKTSDKIQLDLESMDGLPPALVARAAASWYYEIRNAFPLYEIDIYVGWFFWTELMATGANMDWAKDTKWWLPAYPFDPTPKMVNPPLPFSFAQVQDMASKAFTMYAMKDLQPWGQPSYRQITAWADTRYVPGHPAIKKVADINVLNPNYFGTPPAPVPAPTPVPGSAYPAYITTCRVNVRIANSQSSPALGIMEANTTVYIDTLIPLQYSHFQPMAAFPNGGFIATQYLRKA